jgi:hypothetical protein
MSDRFQVFISFKHLDEDGHETPDSQLAREVYHHLTDRGLTVFLSTVSLEQLGIAAYKKAIDDALDSAQALIAVGSSREHLESQWVRYEWDSFFNDILSGIKPKGRVFSYVEGVKVAALPRALRQSQCIEHGPGSLETLQRFVANALPSHASSQSGETGAGTAIPRSPDYVRVSEFLVANRSLTDVSWNAAVKHAKTLKVGGFNDWQLPSIEQLKEVRSADLFDQEARYHSRADAGAEAFYLSFNSGHVNQAPKTYARAISAIFVREAL